METIKETRKTNVKIAVITLDSKAYYKITKILKDHNFSFLSLTPNEKIPNFVNLVITTELEKHLALKTKHITLEELSNSKTQRYIILSKLNDLTCNNITIGIDPGHRTGLIVYNNDKEIYASVCRSINQVKKTVKEIAEDPKTPAKKATTKKAVAKKTTAKKSVTKKTKEDQPTS